MTLFNIDLPNFDSENFEEISPAAQVQFSIKRGNKNYILGRSGKGYTCRERPYCLTEYQISFPAMKYDDAQTLFGIFNSVKHEIEYFPFNDFSDNFVFEWEREAVTQSGVLVEVSGSDPVNPDYQLCKRYTVGQQFSYKPIYFIPEVAEVSINGTVISANDLTLDRNTGILSDFGAGAAGFRFEVDLYYTMVRINSPIQISHYYDEGLENEGIDPDSDPTEDQLYTISFSMKEVRLNRVLDYQNLVPDTELQPIEKFSLDCFVNGAGIDEKRYFNSFEQNDFHAAENPPNSEVVRTITVPSRITKHKDLIYYQTIFKACCGTSFVLT